MCRPGIVHLVLDNYGTHKTALIDNWLVKRPRFQLTSSDKFVLAQSGGAVVRVNHAETDSPRTFRSTKELEDAIHGYLQSYNQNPRPFVSTKTADQILNSLERYCERITDSLH